MTYHISRTVDIPFDEALAKVREELKKEGFGVLTEINVRQTLHEKLNVDFRNYVILGACNPAFAYKALLSEDKVGTMLPCNVIIQEKGPTTSEVSAVDPVASMQAIDNPDLGDVAAQVQSKLRTVIDQL